MQDENAVEATAQAAAPEEGVKIETTNAPASQELDLASEYASLLAENERIVAEKENYKRGLLKAKGKLPVDEEPDSESDIETLIDRKVTERLLNSQESQLLQKKEKLLQESLKKVKELSTALQNRSQLSNTAQGSHTEGPKVKDHYLSDDQIKNLKTRGWSDQKIDRFKLNLKKEKGT